MQFKLIEKLKSPISNYELKSADWILWIEGGGEGNMRELIIWWIGSEESGRKPIVLLIAIYQLLLMKM